MVVSNSVGCRLRFRRNHQLHWCICFLMAAFAATIHVRVLLVDKSDTLNSEAVAQVLRQLVIFLIASKGYLDYVIWFDVTI